jgi:hypothetical protein
MFVDYRCNRCGGVREERLPSPPPAMMTCVACGGSARRLFSAPAVLRSGPATGPAPPAPPPPTCLSHRDIPALCHLDPSVAPAWIARARGDNRALERELARQESLKSGGVGQSTAGPAPVAPTHTHHPAGS